MTATTTPTPAPQEAHARSVPFTVIHSEQEERCANVDVHFQCSAGYEELCSSSEPDEIERLHDLFQAGGAEYTVTYYKKSADCHPKPCGALRCRPQHEWPEEAV
jgi:hypothetical protein